MKARIKMILFVLIQGAILTSALVAVNAYTKAGNDMTVVRSTGVYLDGGNLAGWVEANNTVFDSLQK